MVAGLSRSWRRRFSEHGRPAFVHHKSPREGVGRGGNCICETSDLNQRWRDVSNSCALRDRVCATDFLLVAVRQMERGQRGHENNVAGGRGAERDEIGEEQTRHSSKFQIFFSTLTIDVF